MVKGKPSRNNATLDQYFTIKKPTPDSHQPPFAKNENIAATTIDSTHDIKQHKKTTLASDPKQQLQERKPLAELGGGGLTSQNTTRRHNPAKSFVVLRDDDQDCVTKAQQQQQQQDDDDDDDDINTLATTKTTTQSQFNTQVVPLVDTLNSQSSSITSSPVALADSQDSFLGPGGIEFRVDALDSDDDDTPTTNDQMDGESPFFDHEWHSTNHNKRTRQQSFGNNHNNSDADDDDDDDFYYCDKTRRIDASEQEKDHMSSFEFSTFSPLSVPLDNILQSNSSLSSDDDQDDNDPNGQKQQQQQSPLFTFSSSTLQSNNTSLSDSNDPLTTLPMSPLLLDETVDLHVAYPIPRGTHILDKFGL
ncbi:hypothetical protein BCR42DRAFT_425295 [Absidia repens]|uniref:Uncharacterized protein n=1 Tax=Absidia repens TaxID=90262 RepID=A0A1X2I2Z8_9FUNG|nr:hypothetical protein BCR42DRAFT_425295 [Absidia repens]